MAARHFPSAGGWLALRYCNNEARNINTVKSFSVLEKIRM